jgi:hypothetical protein
MLPTNNHTTYTANHPKYFRPPAERKRIVLPGLLRWVPWFLACVAAAFVLAGRQIGISWDDHNYIAYFNINSDQFSSVISTDIEEPGWGIIIYVIRMFADAFLSLHFVMFISIIIFLLSANKIANGKWTGCNLKSWFIWASFLLIPSLATSAYFAAVRQGLAQSVFLFSVALGAPPLISTILGGSIHSSLVVAGGIHTLSRYANRWLLAVGLLFISLYAIGLATHHLPSPLTGLNLGRRTFVYTNADSLNFFGYAAVLVTYVPIFFLLRRENNQWIRSSMVMFPIVLGLGAVNPGFQRLFMTLDMFMFIGIASMLDKRTAQIAAALFLCATISLGVLESRRGDPRSTYLGQWSLILSHRA